MNVYLKELSKEIKGDFILIMDGAGWHKSKNLIIPKNIQIILLPPYCPELNPVERLWRYIKDNTIKNKVFETLTELENLVCKFVRNLGNEIIKNTCFVNDQLES
jgi:transposase